MSVTAIAVAAGAFLTMEPVTYAAHRWVMHGWGDAWHRSHHRFGSTGWERNDRFPLVFAAFVVAAISVGFNVAGWSLLVPAGMGVTGYGAAYALVHDVYIHRRFGRWRRTGAGHARPTPPGRREARGRPGPLTRLGAAHELHHRFGGEPFGMLLPIVPRAVRARAAQPLPTRPGG